MLIQTLLVAIAFLLHGEQWLLVDGFHQIKTIPSSFILSKINIGLLRSTSLTSLQLFPSPTAYSSPSNTMNQQYTSRIHRNKRRKSQTELRSSRGRANNSPNNDPDNPYYKGMDAYQILGIARTSKRDEIKKAYKKLVFQWHADRVPRDDKEKREEHEKRMKKINWAYWCLEDEERRQRYDKYGEAGVGTSETSEQQLKENGGPMPQGFGGFGGAGGGAVDLEGVDVGDLFEAFFGGGGGSPFGSSGFGGGRRAGASSARRNPNEPMEGEDLQIEHPIPFMTSIFGGSERLRVRRLEQCKICSGSGVKPGAKIKTCSSCNGQGATMRIQRTPLGAIQSVQQCPTCRGTGQEIEEYCGTCRGKGTTVEMKEVDVRIPAGVDSGTTLRVREAGNAGKKGGRRGDLFVKITVRDDPRFKREGATIFTEEEISFTDAILGAVLKVETVDGKTEIRIPAGTQPDQKLRIRGKGVPQLGSADARGDQIITMKVRIPTKISDKEKELVQQLAQLSGGAK